MANIVCNKLNNKTNSQCPARMSDSRIFTDYSSSCSSNLLFKNRNNLRCSHDYRMFLTNNAVKLMQGNSKNAWDINGCNLCLGTDQTIRPGNSTPANFSNCIPPADYLRYNGAIPVKGNVLNRNVQPSGASLSHVGNDQYTSHPPQF